jgi:uncharacterized protein YndB with AHSA1/START domain
VAIIKRSQVISAPIEDAFNVVTDAGSFASWNPTIRASRQLDDGPVGNGTRFEWDLRGFGKVTQELREFDRNRQVRIVPQMKQIEGGHRFRFSKQGEQTRIDHELEMKPFAVSSVESLSSRPTRRRFCARGMTCGEPYLTARNRYRLRLKK